MSIENIKTHLLELFQNTPDNVGVMYGKKSKNGNFTGENCVVFTVVKKRPIEELSENEILPTYVEFDGVRYETDVLEVGEHYLYDCQDLMNSGCYSWNGNVMPTTYPPWCCQFPGSPPNRNIIRPLQQGISVTSINASTPTTSVGTLGFFAVDKLTKCLVGVSNNHVLIDNAYYTSQRRDITIIENEYSDDVIQTFDWDAINFGSSPPKIGSVLRYVPIKKQPNINYVDGALTTIFSGSVATGLDNTTPKSWFFYGLSGLTNRILEAPMEWATTQEIDNLMVDPPSQVWSVGRTTGVKQGPCGLQILGVGDSSNVRGYNDAGQQQIISYADLIRFSRLNNQSCTFPIGPGDSGSALIAVIGGKPKIIGLCFAGSMYTGLACRIDRVAEELDIERWDGVNQSFFDPNQQDIFTVTGTSQNKTLVCSGQTYWQVGNTNLDLPCTQQGLFFQIDTMSAFTFNLRVASSSNINMTIYWGDGTSTTYVGAPGYNVSQVITTLGIYSIQVVFSNYNIVTSLTAGFVSGLQPGAYRFPIINVYNLNLLINLQILSIGFCKLSSSETLIPQLSSTLKNIILSNNSFTSFTSAQFLPIGLTFLSLYNNPFTQTGLNDTLIYLDNIPFNALPPKTINLTSSIPTAIPSGSGLVAKNNLINEFWVILTL